MVINHMCQENVELTYFLLKYTTVASDNKPILSLWFSICFRLQLVSIGILILFNIYLSEFDEAEIAVHILNSHELTFDIMNEFFYEQHHFGAIFWKLFWDVWKVCPRLNLYLVPTKLEQHSQDEPFQPESKCKSSFHFITNYIVWCEWTTCRTTKSFQPESNVFLLL